MSLLGLEAPGDQGIRFRNCTGGVAIYRGNQVRTKTGLGLYGAGAGEERFSAYKWSFKPGVSRDHQGKLEQPAGKCGQKPGQGQLGQDQTLKVFEQALS